MPSTLTDPSDAPDKAEPLSLGHWLTLDNEVLRSTAYRALPACGTSPETCRQLYLDALMDPDPDIRSDAMEALVCRARPEDAEVIRQSLLGDPVREVKLAAMRLLSDLGDQGSIPILRALVLSRHEPDVAWEDELGDWDDWLDVQIEAIAALGRIGAVEAIEDFFAARDDEYGQTLDGPVFEALTKLGLEGASWLLAVVKTERGLSRKRAAEALERSDAEALRDHLPVLVEAEDPALRHIAIAHLPGDDATLRAMVRDDPEPGVRAAALRRASECDAEVARAGLSDPDDLVKVVALECLEAPFDPEFAAVLADNLLAWVSARGTSLAKAATLHLPSVAPDRAADALLGLVHSAERPLDLRVCAVRALEELPGPVSTDAIVDLLANPATQIRCAALTLLKARAVAGEAEAMEALAAAIRADLFSADAVRAAHGPEADVDVAMSKAEGSARPRIRITQEGDIVEVDDAEEKSSAAPGASTMDAILAHGSVLSRPAVDEDEQASEPEADLAEDTPEESPARRKRRRAVEGSDDVAGSLSYEALRIGGDVESEAVRAALLQRLKDPDQQTRRLAWEVFGGTGTALNSGEVLAAALADEDPVVRLVAFQCAVSEGALDTSRLEAALADPDALLRAQAVATLAPERALAHLSDAAGAVRGAALERLMASTKHLKQEAVDALLSAERVDTLSVLLSKAADARVLVLKKLTVPDLPPRKALVLLDALARTVSPATES